MTAFPPEQNTPPPAQAGRPDFGRPAPTRSNTTVLMVTLITVLVIGGGLSAWLLASPSYDRSTARGTAEAFADAVNSNDVEGVQGLICGSDQRQLRGALAAIVANTTVTIDRVEVSGARATAFATGSMNVLGTAAGSGSVEIPLRQTGDDGQWEICGLSQAGLGR